MDQFFYWRTLYQNIDMFSVPVLRGSCLYDRPHSLLLVTYRASTVSKFKQLWPILGLNRGIWPDSAGKKNTRHVTLMRHLNRNGLPIS
jgi:hypothetical protein